MKVFLSVLATFTLFFILMVLGIWFFSPLIQKEEALTSPLPDFLTRSKNNQVSTLDLFLPALQNFLSGGTKKPEISAIAGLIYDVKTNKTLFAKAADEKLPMASLTKIMTAVVALENPQEDDKYFVLQEYLVGENSMGVTQGEVLTLNELMYGLILPSGNDAAEVLAGNYPTGRGGFIQAMNDKATALGLKNTRFTNPSGLQGDGEQYTTAADILVITRYAIKEFPIFRKVAATATYEIPYSNNHKYFYLVNETNLLTSYPGVKGVKTGYTPEAGLCLVTYFNDGKAELIGIILGSNNRRSDMAHLLDYSLSQLGIKVKHTVY